jgi:hypothetical protein
MVARRLNGAFVKLAPAHGGDARLYEVYLDFKNDIRVYLDARSGVPAYLLSGSNMTLDNGWVWSDLTLPLSWVVDESRCHGYIHVHDVARKAAHRLGVGE